MPMAANAFDILKKFHYLLNRSQKRWGMVIFVMAFVGALLETLGVSSILPLMNVMLEPDALLQNAYVADAAALFGIKDSDQLLIGCVVLLILVYVIKNIYLLFYAYVSAKYACKVQRELSVKMMRYYMRRGYLFFVGHNSSELMRGINTTPSNVYQVLSILLKMVSESLTVACICMLVIATDVRMAAVMAVLIVACMTAIIFVFKNMMKGFGRKYHRYYMKATKSAMQAFQGIKEVLVMRRQEYFAKVYEEAYIQQQKATIGKTIAMTSPGYFIEAVCVAVLLVYVCIQCLYSEDVTALIPTLGVFALGAFRILPAIGRISSGVNNIVFFIPSIQEMYDNFKEVEENADAEEWDASGADAEGRLAFEKTIDVKNLSWKYPNMDQYVLENVNLTIHKGESVALIGASGSGKTTLADILLGLLVPEEGDILLDGNSALHSPAQWGNLISFVSQAFYLNDDTIRNNVAFGVEEKKIDDAAVWKALGQAQLKEFVEGLPNGIDTVVGERGVRFSGGQRQRIAIARALYANPDILILDEATAALDNETEAAVMEAVEHLQGEITLIIIAHRLTTIRNCDKVYEVKQGKVTERSKEEVLAMGNMEAREGSPS